MKLLAFRVRDFRSVDDSGWIDVEQVTAFVGTNEAGKTNVLTPLWKLKPAKGGEIEAIADYPRKRYNVIRERQPKPIFIDARFELSEPVVKAAARKLRVSAELLKEATVSRDLDGRYFVRFHTLGGARVVSREVVQRELQFAFEDLVMASFKEEDEALKQEMKAVVQRAIALVAAGSVPEIEGHELLQLEALLGSVDLRETAVTSALTGRYAQVVKIVTDLPSIVAESERQAARDLVIASVPTFVYYSNFGNLDAEIYLPHVIENLKRTDLGSKEAAKARTLKVLFDFVKLSPEEIMGLGHGSAEQKKEREILLQSAATELTRGFREWWRQGDYTFRFQADGDHFRIWVSDARRPEPIELESRSSGLQFFLSFYLVFMEETAHAAERQILLLDEPGLSLHPLAQHDLSAFFDGLARTNQLVYTTHSPFMIDTDHLDRARAVYADERGVTQVSDLRSPRDASDKAKSVYAAYAAVAVAAGDALLVGGQPVIVESESDQHYLTAIKNYLIRTGQFRPVRDILFLAAGNAKGARTLADLVSAGGETLPFVLLDADAAGRTLAIGLKEGLYKSDLSRLLAVSDFREVVDGEIEDLFPTAYLAPQVDRFLRKPGGIEEDFSDVVKDGLAFVPQVEAYAARHRIALDRRWRVEFAKRVKRAMLKSKGDPLRGDQEYVEGWRRIFETLHPAES